MGQGARRRLPVDVSPESRSRPSPIRREELGELEKAPYDVLAKPRDGGPDLAGLQGPGGVFLRMPELRKHLGAINRYLRSEAGIDPLLVKIAILATARQMDSQFEWTMHEPVARRKGIPQRTIDLIKHGKALAGIPEHEAAVIELARGSLGAHKVCSRTHARVLKVFGERGLLNIVALIASYATTAITLCVFDQQLHDGQAPLLPETIGEPMPGVTYGGA